MPNYCENTLTIKGDKATLNTIINTYFNGRDFDFNKIIPMPKTKRDCPELYIFEHPELSHLTNEKGFEWFDSYNWSIDKWGTKWNAIETNISWVNDNTIMITFDTAWTPAKPVIIALIALFSELDFYYTYYEPGCEIAGFISHYKGTAKDYYEDVQIDSDDQEEYRGFLIAEDYESEETFEILDTWNEE